MSRDNLIFRGPAISDLLLTRIPRYPGYPVSRTEIGFSHLNYNEKKTAKKKRRASWFSRYSGQSSRLSAGDSMKIRIRYNMQ